MFPFRELSLIVALNFYLIVTPISSSSIGTSSSIKFNATNNCPNGTVCSTFLDCRTVLTAKNEKQFVDRICLKSGQIGLCCPIIDDCVEDSPGSRSALILTSIDEDDGNGVLLQSPTLSGIIDGSLSLNDFKSVIDEAKSASEQIVSHVAKVFADHRVRRKSRFTRSSDAHTQTREEVYQRNLGIVPNISDIGSADDARYIQQLTISMAKRLGLTTPKQIATLKSIQIIEADKCSVNISCNPYGKYRPIDGSCNNLDHPDWGKVLTPYSRVLLPQYGDSIDAPKLLGSKGDQLPLARLLSTSLIKDKPMEHHNLDTMALAYGQFLDHDLTQVVGSTLPDGGAISCCDTKTNKLLASELLHPSCFAIEIPLDDAFYSQYGVECLNFARTAFGLPENCVLGPRTQINNLTPWLDGSIIYGSSNEASKKLRAFKGGMMDHQTTSAGEVLPPQGDICNNNTQCLGGGDSRVNQQPGLMATHITWLREHNRIASELAKLNPHWTDDDLFQEARRIVIAEFQHVTFDEFLPQIIGADLMKKYNLYSRKSGFNQYYDANLSPAIIQEFASAAFRLHTLIPEKIELRDNNLKVTREVPLKTQFYNPSVFYEKPTVYQSIINGLLSQPTCPADSIMTQAITNYLFPPGTYGSDEPWGFDLFSIDIQRGRDHGLVGYNEWRRACGFKVASNFSDLADSFYSESLPLVESLYSSVNDIDLVVGLNLEPRPEGQNVGPTAACIITETFRRLKFSDRFWYENSGQPSSFTLDQLTSIRNVTYARIHCDNNGIESSQEMALLQPSELNPRIPCSKLSSSSVDLNLWKNEPLGNNGVSLL